MDMRDIKPKQTPSPKVVPPSVPLPEVVASSENEEVVALPGVPVPPASRGRVRSFIRRHFLTLGFVFGFIIDNLTLNRVDQVLDNAILATYVVLAMVSMLLLYAGAAGKLPEWIGDAARRFAPFVMQYAFGGLLSGMLIFYGRSGAWAASWPYLAIIILAIYGNETIKDRSTRLLYNLAILFIGLFSYIVLLVPVVTKLMGPWIFIGSGFIALMIMYGFLRLLNRIIPRFIELQQRAIILSLGMVYVGFNFLYFSNMIPPIPLSLKEAGIYHFVARFENETYQVKYEEGPWWQFWKKSDSTIHPRGGESIFCYAEVFAPTRFEIDIVHVWEFNDPEAGWTERARIAYPITGGRDSGYRGYTLINNYQNGDWRCSVETERGQVIGRETFTVDTTESPKALVTEIR
jgi:hypothetical protein